MDRDRRLRSILDGSALFFNRNANSVELLVPIDAITLPLDAPMQSYLLWIAVQMSRRRVALPMSMLVKRSSS